MKVIIVDDEERARVSLRYLISEFLPNVEIVAECDGIPNAVKSIHKFHPDLVFLDIEMPGHSGLEILDFFDEKDLNFGIIFTTAYQEYAIKAFKLSAVDYLLKPINPSELTEAIERYSKINTQKINLLNTNLGRNTISCDKKIGIPMNNGIELINPENIIYIKAEGAYSEIHLTEGKKILASKNLKMFEESLTDYESLIRVHKSYLVNFKHVISITKSNGGNITLCNAMKIPFNTESYEILLEKINLIRK